MTVFAFVFARGGSKGLPRKNILPLGGKPLLGWSIDLAKSLIDIDRVFVSTEDAEIARVGMDHGAEIIDRPSHLAADDAPEWWAWQHAIKTASERFGSFDIFLSLPATAPLRTAADITTVLEALNESWDIVLTMTESERSPWFNMVKYREDGVLTTVNENDGTIARRQDAPKTYDLTTVAYAAYPQFILKSRSIWEGRVTGVEVSKKSAVDIDTKLDFQFAEYLINTSR